MHNKRIGRDDLLKIEVGIRYKLEVSEFDTDNCHSGLAPRRLQAGASMLAVHHADPSVLHVAAQDRRRRVAAMMMMLGIVSTSHATATAVIAATESARAAQTIVTEK